MSKRKLKQEIRNIKVREGDLLFIYQEGGTAESIDELREKLNEIMNKLKIKSQEDFSHQAIISNFRIKVKYVNVEGIRALCVSGDGLTPAETKEMFGESLRQIKSAIEDAATGKYMDYLTGLLKEHGIEYKSYYAWVGRTSKACSRYSIISGGI